MDSTNGMEQETQKRGAPKHVAAMTPDERRAYLSTLGKRSGETRRKKRLEQEQTTVSQSEQIERTIAEHLARTTQTTQTIPKLHQTELDKKIDWLSAMIEALQEHAPLKYNEIRRLDETLAKLIDIRTKVLMACEDQLTTTEIWEGVAETITSTVADEKLRHQLLSKIHEFLSTLIKEALERQDEKKERTKGRR